MEDCVDVLAAGASAEMTETELLPESVTKTSPLAESYATPAGLWPTPTLSTTSFVASEMTETAVP